MTSDQPPTGCSGLLEIDRLHIAFGHGATAIEPVAGASLTIAAGRIRALVGRSGSGKSTLARALLGLLPASARIVAGAIRLDGRDLHELDERAWQRLRGRVLTLIPQDPFAALDPLLSVGQQLRETLSVVAGTPCRHADERALELLAAVGLPESKAMLHAYPHQLSGGMAQRVSVALALAAAPCWLVADEPTAALDPDRATGVLDLLANLACREGLGILLVTHDIAAAERVAHDLSVMVDGRIEPGGRTGHRADASLAPDRRRGPIPFPARRHGISRRPLLRLENVCVDPCMVDRKNRSPPPHRRLLHEVCMQIHDGEAVAVVGASGSGKSMLAATIMGLVRPSSGLIHFGQLDPRSGGVGRREVQLVFQDYAGSLDRRWTVSAIIVEPLRAYGLAEDRRAAERQVLELLDRVGLDRSLASARPGTLSGGQQQRVALARALAARPRLLILDEVTSAQDGATRDGIVHLLEEYHRSGTSMLLISHDPTVVAPLADRVLTMTEGRLSGDPSMCHSAPPSTNSWADPPTQDAGRRSAEGRLVEAAQLA